MGVGLAPHDATKELPTCKLLQSKHSVVMLAGGTIILSN